MTFITPKIQNFNFGKTKKSSSRRGKKITLKKNGLNLF